MNHASHSANPSGETADITSCDAWGGDDGYNRVVVLLKSLAHIQSNEITCPFGGFIWLLAIDADAYTDTISASSFKIFDKCYLRFNALPVLNGERGVGCCA